MNSLLISLAGASSFPEGLLGGQVWWLSSCFLGIGKDTHERMVLNIILGVRFVVCAVEEIKGGQWEACTLCFATVCSDKLYWRVAMAVSMAMPPSPLLSCPFPCSSIGNRK